MHRITRAALAGALGLAVALTGIAAPALASPSTPAAYADETPPRTIADIKTAASVAITKRLAALTNTATLATASTLLSEPHRATILATSATQQAGLSALADTIEADTDRATAALHYSQIFTEYRVFAVVVPQAHFATAADGIATSVVPQLQVAHDALVELATASPDLLAKLELMQAQIDAAGAAIAGVGDTALAVTPAEYNDNPTALTGVRTSIVTARAAATQARAIAASVIEELR